MDNCSQNDKNTLENIKYNALRLVIGCKKGTSRQLLLEETGLCRPGEHFIKFYNFIA